MSLRELLLWAAVPVPAEVERGAARQRHVHHVLRGDGVLSRVFGHVAASAASTACRDVGTLTTEDELLPAASTHAHGMCPAALPDLIPSPDPSAPPPPDLTTTGTVNAATVNAGNVSAANAVNAAAVNAAAVTAPPSYDLCWALEQVLATFRPSPPPPPPPPPRKRSRITRRDLIRGRGARPREKPGSGGGGGGGGGGVGGGGGGGGVERTASVADTLCRHVGEELRRIADQLQLNRLVGWPTHEEILRDVVDRHPLLTGLAGCAVVAGFSVALSRALRP